MNLYHASTIGEYFHGNLPIISQIMLILFKIQARWVAWSTEHHINHYAFADEEGEAEEMEEQSRANMPLFLLKNYAWSDLMAMMFGYSNELSIEKQPSFLVIDEEEKKESTVQVDADGDKLPFQRKEVKIQISEDILSDRKVLKELLASNNTQSAEDVKTILVRRHTLNARRRHTKSDKKKETRVEEEDESEEEEEVPVTGTGVYVMAKDLAVDRAQMRRMTRKRTSRGN